MSITVSRTKDISDKPSVRFTDLECIAADMATVIQFTQIIEKLGGLNIQTASGKDVFGRMAQHYLEHCEREAHRLQFERDHEIGKFRSKINDLEDEISELKSKLKRKVERTETGVKVTATGEPVEVELQRVPDTQRGSLKDA